jgi:Spy/CpxP family protein refolding chaperone
MKTPRTRQHLGHWIAAALLGSACLNLWAQSGPPSAHPTTTAEHRSMERMQGQHQRHLQTLKSKLQLSAEQEAAWTAFANAMTPPARAALADRQAERAELAKLTTPERIDRIKLLREQRQAEMNAYADRRGQASKAFYASLNAQQKKVFDEETARLMSHRGERGPRPHGGRHGHG